MHNEMNNKQQQLWNARVSCLDAVLTSAHQGSQGSSRRSRLSRERRLTARRLLKHLVMSDSSDQSRAPDSLVLIVEDDDAISDLLARLLAKHGYRTMRARDGIDAINMLQCESVVPSLILVDLVMPRMGGLELIERLDRDNSSRDVPVVVMSGHSRLQHAARVRFLDFLPKPFEASELLGIVRAASQASCSRWTVASMDRATFTG
jgi:CheY-like chemotaxis protein